MPNPTEGWDLVVSYGDLSHSSGYRTRVMGELEHLDRHSGFDPFLLLFDRQPDEFVRWKRIDIPFRAIARSAVIRFYTEVARLARQKPIRIVHAHNLYSAALALSTRSIHQYKVVLDYHGRIPEEYVSLGKGGDGSRQALEHLEGWAVRRADHIVVVSHKLGEYLEARYKIPRTKISIIPCATDSNKFRWDMDIRVKTRHRLGLEQAFVCTHLGTFFDWYEPELLIRAFQEIQSHFVNAHLLVITADLVNAHNYLATRLDASEFTVLTVEHTEVPGLLNASDLGFLLLRSSANIHTSSPVKFAEYLNCGVPVAITPNVGDYSELVDASGVGLILRDGEALDVSELKCPREEMAIKCVAAARPLTWTALMKTWESAVQHACGSE